MRVVLPSLSVIYSTTLIMGPAQRAECCYWIRTSLSKRSTFQELKAAYFYHALAFFLAPCHYETNGKLEVWGGGFVPESKGKVPVWVCSQFGLIIIDRMKNHKCLTHLKHAGWENLLSSITNLIILCFYCIENCDHGYSWAITLQAHNTTIFISTLRTFYSSDKQLGHQKLRENSAGLPTK